MVGMTRLVRSGGAEGSTCNTMNHFGRGYRIRTDDLATPSGARYQLR